MSSIALVMEKNEVFRGHQALRIYSDRDFSEPFVWSQKYEEKEATTIAEFSLGKDLLGGVETNQELFNFGLNRTTLGSTTGKLGEYWYWHWFKENTYSSSQNQFPERYIFLSPCQCIDNFEGYSYYSTLDKLKPPLNSSWNVLSGYYTAGNIDRDIARKTFSSPVNLSTFNVFSFFGLGSFRIGFRFLDRSSNSSHIMYFSTSGRVSVYNEEEDTYLSVNLWRRYEQTISWNNIDNRHIKYFDIIIFDEAIVDDLFVLRTDKNLFGTKLELTRETNAAVLKIPLRFFEVTQVGGRKNLRGRCNVVDLAEPDINYIREMKDLSQLIYIKMDNFAVPVYIENVEKTYKQTTPRGLGQEMVISFVEENPFEA